MAPMPTPSSAASNVKYEAPFAPLSAIAIGVVDNASMKDSDAFRLATEMLGRFVDSQEIPPGGTSGSAASHGQKTGEFLAALHKALYDYFREAGSG